MNNKLYVVGIGPGNKDFIYPAAQKLIEASDVLIGGKRNLELFKYLNKEEIIIGSKLNDIDSYIFENICKKKIVVLATGDPGIFSITEYLKNKLGDIDIEVYPGISSFQYLCAKVKMNWDDIFILSLHGRELEDLAGVLESHDKVAIFTGGNSSPDSVSRELTERGLGDLMVTVGENLSYQDERIVKGTAHEIGNMKFNSLSIMLVVNKFKASSSNEIWEFTTPGILDEMFVRGDVPMTKEEVRSVTLSKLRLKEDSVLFDIGAGTGSVSIECGLRMKKGKVYAIEKEIDAVELIKKNCLKFGLRNLNVVEGEAPTALNGLPIPDRVFIGGTNGSMEGILEWVYKIAGSVRVVVNAVAIETVCEAVEGLTGRGFKNIDITCVSISRGRPVGKKHLMQALNPVYIISGERL